MNIFETEKGKKIVKNGAEKLNFFEKMTSAKMK